MKTAISLLFILAFGVGALWYKFSADQAHAAKQVAIDDLQKAKEEIKRIKGDLSKSENSLYEAKTQIELLNRKVTGLEKDLAGVDLDQQRLDQAEAQRLAAEQAALDAEGKAKTLDERLSQLRVIYERNLTGLNTQKATLVANRQKAEEIKKSLQKNQPKFVEHEISETGMKGIRLSEADRKEVIAKWQAEVAQATAQVEAIDLAMIDLDAKISLLETSYREAQDQAERDF